MELASNKNPLLMHYSQ